MSAIQFSNEQSVSQVKTVQNNWDKRILWIAVKALAYVVLMVGSIASIAGGITGVFLFGRIYLASESGTKIFRALSGVLFPLGNRLGEISLNLMTSPLTALGACITIPLTGICYGLPFMPPFLGLAGALPGLALTMAARKVIAYQN